ncbi:cell division topological specificity factor MinE [Dehalobacter sp. DCM]|uniref:cell division topological specificity factor MinE n=1 Tax=Dehalobacter sp. DCM TaxID=2907827 RepID=UPI0030813F0A|nr:cell division topological specificity factor MinE [Dehalobacter sp. DCM]
MWELLNRIWGKNNSSSRIHAKERLRLVLVHDRATVSPYLMNRVKEDLLKTITNYMVIDDTKAEILLNQDDHDVWLVAKIPVRKIRRDYMERAQSIS